MTVPPIGAEPPDDPIAAKMRAHDLGVDVLRNVNAALLTGIERLKEFETANPEVGRQGTTLQPVRSAAVRLRQIQAALAPALRDVEKRAANFEGANFESDDGPELGAG